jgi:flavin reductase (DIM6/NTAB) family NADH-FMN oxidoreductase RutF
MFPLTSTAKFNTRYFPLHLALVSVGDNFLPMGNWMVIGKEPFRFLLAMGVGNHSLTLLKKHKEAALHFFPWSERAWIVRAGHLSGRDVNKAELLGRTLEPAQKLTATRLVSGYEAVFELVVNRELTMLSREFALFIMDCVASAGTLEPQQRQPILFLSQEDFATVGERWEYTK